MRVFTMGIDSTTREFLRINGMVVALEKVSTPEEVCDWVVDGSYEAVVIDLDSTKWGIFVVRYFRSKKILVPFVAITKGEQGTSWSEQRASFLENGGDDFIRGPANPRELVASLRAVTRRNRGTTLDVAEFVNGAAVVRVNLSLQSVTVNGSSIHLTSKETLLLCLLASTQNRVQSKEALLTSLYSSVEDEADIKIIDVFICKLRAKLEAAHPDAVGVIETVWGRGYQMRSEEKSTTEVA